MSWFRISLKSQILCHVTWWSAAPPVSPFPGPPPGVQSYMMCQNRTPLVSARAGSLSLHSKQWPNNNHFITSRGSGGLPSMGSHRVGHDWSDLAAAWFCGWDVWCGLCWVYLLSQVAMTRVTWWCSAGGSSGLRRSKVAPGGLVGMARGLGSPCGLSSWAVISDSQRQEAPLETVVWSLGWNWPSITPANQSQRDGQKTCFSTGMDGSLVAKLCLTLCESIDAHGISQARILEWVAIFFWRGSFWPRDQTCFSCLVGGFFTTEPPGKPFLNGRSI